MRASTSARLSGESFTISAGCCSGGATLLDGSERCPPPLEARGKESAAATFAGSFSGDGAEGSALAGATAATAEARAARRANSRRERLSGLAELGLEVSSIKNLHLRPGHDVGSL